MKDYAVFIPADMHLSAPTTAATIDPASGIVGVPFEEPGRLNLYYEGNRFRAKNIRTFADRCYHAASRLETRYPTIACGLFPERDFEQVGTLVGGERVEVEGADDTIARGVAGATVGGRDDKVIRLAMWIGAGHVDGQMFVLDTLRLDAELRVTR